MRKPAGLWTKKIINFCAKGPQNDFSQAPEMLWFTLLQPTGNFSGLSSTEEMHVAIYPGFATEMCNSLQEKAQLRPGGTCHHDPDCPLQSRWPQMVGFVKIRAPICRGGFQNINSCLVPRNKTTFSFVSGRSLSTLPFSFIHVGRKWK